MFNQLLYSPLSGYAITFRFFNGSNSSNLKFPLLPVANQIKSGTNISYRDCSGLLSLHKDFPKVPCFICAPVDNDRTLEKNISVVSPHSLMEKIKAL